MDDWISQKFIAAHWVKEISPRADDPIPGQFNQNLSGELPKIFNRQMLYL
ncbi:hypothetical protein [Microbulbifer sp. TYP-18]